MGPYYSKAYQEMWLGIGIMTYVYYKMSFGGEFWCMNLYNVLEMQLYLIVQMNVE